MALRTILTKEEPTLYKKCRPVVKFDARLHQLLDDMADTLAQANGVGLAAPQVGVLRRAVIVLETNVPEGEDEYLIELINPISCGISPLQTLQRAMRRRSSPALSRSRFADPRIRCLI